MKLGEYRFFRIFEGTGAWASVPSTEEWRKPFKFMGPIEMVKPKPPPLPPLIFDCEIKHETDMAWLVEIEGEKYWMPKSVCKLIDDSQIRMPRWLWQQKCQEPVE